MPPFSVVRNAYRVRALSGACPVQARQGRTAEDAGGAEDHLLASANHGDTEDTEKCWKLFSVTSVSPWFQLLKCKCPATSATSATSASPAVHALAEQMPPHPP